MKQLAKLAQAIAHGPRLLLMLGPGYAITGGSRGGVWPKSVFELGGLRPPWNWRLLETLPGPLGPLRREPLRIFAIDP